MYDHENQELLHTITDEAIDLKVKQTLTDNVGTFSFTLPTTKDGFAFDYLTQPIEPFWFADFTLAWMDQLNEMFSFIGQIFPIQATATDDLGYRRTYKGRDYGCYLQRNFQGYNKWEAVAANTVVEDIADDLGMGKTKIEADATLVTITVDVDQHDSYFNILRAVSDYWFDAGTQIKKDFYVDENYDLVWASRPLRSSGVESIDVADMTAYNLFQDIQAVKNWIRVYGSKELAYPADHDELTEDLTLVGNTLETTNATWTVFGGGATISKDATEDVGDWCVRTDGGAGAGLYLTFDGGHEVNADLYPQLIFHVFSETGQPDLVVELEDTGGEKTSKLVIVKDGQYDLISFGWGKKNEQQWTPDTANVNPFNWNEIEVIHFNTNVAAGWSLRIDGLHWNNRAFYGFASDATSYGLYGYADLVHVDEALKSSADCEKRAEALLFQKCVAPLRLDFQVSGNPNIKIGDRIPITIPAEGLTAENFDVITVEHVLSGVPIGWRTNVTALNTGDMRTAPAISMPEYLVREKIVNMKVGRGEVIVR